MMTCDEIQRILSLCDVDERPPVEDLRRHLEDCSDCQAKHEDVLSFFRDVEPELVSGVQQRVRSGGRMMAAVVAILGMSGFFFVSQASDPVDHQLSIHAPRKNGPTTSLVSLETKGRSLSGKVSLTLESSSAKEPRRRFVVAVESRVHRSSPSCLLKKEEVSP